MFKMLFKLIFMFYIYTGIICFGLQNIIILCNMLHIGEMPDVWKALKEIQQMLDEIKNEKLKEFTINIINSCIENKANCIILILVFSFIPILHIFFSISAIKDISKRFQ